jgi:iron complex outermembrane receptor protein
VYDFRSENERRRIDALQSTLSGAVALGGLTHRVALEFLLSRTRNRFGPQVYNYSGTGNVAGTAITPAAPTLGDPSAPLDERSTEFALRDTVVLQPGLTAWLGLRHTALERDSGDTRVRQQLNTPFVALGYAPAANTLVYASWGQGLEALAVPQRLLYTNAGQVLPALASKQAEVGARGNWKFDGHTLDANVALFDIAQPQSADFGTCDAPQTCTTRVDGNERHQGLEANTTWLLGPFTARLGGQFLRARREGSAKPGTNGLQPTNVPAHSLKAGLEYRVPQLAGLTLHTRLVAESRRQALPDNSLQIPGLAHVDAGLRYATAFAGRRATWRLNIDNLTDLRAWRESPYQFSHAYLYPLGPRTFSASLDIDL